MTKNDATALIVCLQETQNRDAPLTAVKMTNAMVVARRDCKTKKMSTRLENTDHTEGFYEESNGIYDRSICL